jgi:hypothetical protein
MRRPGGHYDENLVCEACERLFAPWDDYAAALFLNELRTDGEPIKAPSGAVAASLYPGVEYFRLKMFAISLLWRASATKLGFFSGINLGPYEERARGLILTPDTGGESEFQVLITRWTAQERHRPLAETQFSPYLGRLEGVNNTRFFLAGSMLQVKVDKRPYPAPLPEIVLRRDLPLVVIARQFEGSNDVLALRPALEKLAARYGKKQE